MFVEALAALTLTIPVAAQYGRFPFNWPLTCDGTNCSMASGNLTIGVTVPEGTKALGVERATIYDATPITGATRFVIRAGAADNDTAPLGAELTTNGAFASDLSGWTVSGTGTGWTWSTGTALHGAGNTETLSQNITVANGTTYQVEFTMSGRTAGGVTVTVGAVTLVCYPWGLSFTGNATWQRTLVASGSGAQAVTFTPTADFDGAIDAVTIKAITGTIPSLVTSKNNAGTAAYEIRANPTLSNLGLGVDSLRSNTVGYSNLGLGVDSLRSNTAGIYNLGLGVSSLYSNTTGSDNLGLGVSSLYSNTTGYYNLGLGVNSLRSNTAGYYNFGLGVNSLYSNTTGYSNLGLGVDSLRSNTTGYSNLGLGVEAGYTATPTNATTTGHHQTLVGYRTGQSTTTQRNYLTVIGAEATADCDNCVVLGRTADAVVMPGAIKTPASASAACTAGELAFDANYVYLCVATNTWLRAAIATW